MSSNTLKNLRSLNESIDDIGSESSVVDIDVPSVSDAPSEDFGEVSDTPSEDAVYPEFFADESFLSEMLGELVSVNELDLEGLSEEEIKEKQAEGFAKIKGILNSFCPDCEDSAEPVSDEFSEEAPAEAPSDFDSELSDL